MSGQLNLVYDVHDGEDIHGARLVRLTNQDLVEASYRHPHRGTGYGSITLQATSTHHTNLVQDHYVRVRDVDLSYAVVGGFFLEEFEETVLSKKEGGGKLITWKGSSTISYLARAVLDDEVRSPAAGPYDQYWIDTTGNWHWGSAGGEAYGDIIRRIIVEAGLQTPNPIPAIGSVTSTATETFVGTFEIPVSNGGLLQAVMRLARTGIDVWIDPDTFDIKIVDEGGFVRDKTGAFGAGTVRFEGGVNIAADLKRAKHQSQYVSHMVVVGQEVEPFTVVDPLWSSGDPVRGGTLRSDLTHVTDLTREARADIRARRRKIEQAAFPHDAGDDPTNGVYRPSDRNVGGHYAPGDLVTLHTGIGAGQYNELSIEVAAVTWVLEENGLHSARVELGSSYVSSRQQSSDNRLGNLIGCTCPKLCGPGFACEELSANQLTAGTATNGDAEDTGGSQWSGGGYLTSHQYGGSRSYGVASASSVDLAYAFDPAQVFEAGTRYVLESWFEHGAAAISGVISFGVQGTDDSTDAHLIESGTGSDGHTWNRYRICWTPTADRTGARMRWQLTQASASFAAVDDLALYTADNDLLAGTSGRAARCDHGHRALDIALGGTSAGLTATDVQAGFEEHVPDVDGHHAQDHATRHQSGGADSVKLDDLAAPDDNTDLNVSASAHGLVPKLPNDASKFLDGTGSWSAPAGGPGGADSTQRAILSARRTNATTSFADVTDLGFAIGANKNYHFRFVLHYWTNATTTGIRFGVNGPASPTRVWIGGLIPSSAPGNSAQISHSVAAAYDTAIVATTTGPGFASSFCILEGVIENGANAGTLQLRFASEVAVAGGAVVETGSYGEISEIA